MNISDCTGQYKFISTGFIQWIDNGTSLQKALIISFDESGINL